MRSQITFHFLANISSPETQIDFKFYYLLEFG